MNNIEELLWNYIDGTCSADEQKTISALIKSDEEVRVKYQELLNLNREFSAIELDEPSMAFTYNIMEAIRTENAQVPLKATINNRIIWGIAAFFIVSIFVLLVFTMTRMNWSGGNVSIDFSTGFKMPDISKYLSGPVIKGFLFFDVVLGMFLLDSYLRKRNFLKQV
jgi:hypothetical protein